MQAYVTLVRRELGSFFYSWIAYIVIAVTINASPCKQGKHDELAGGTQVIKV